MQLCAGLFVILAVVSRSSSQKEERIIRNDFDGPNPDGSYKWAFQTEGGIFHEQRGSLQPSASGDEALVVEGQYQYTAPDGQVINLLYRADETGFHPSGDHLPTPPPIPPAIQRALDFLATKPPPIDEGGIFHEQRGSLQPSASGDEALVVEGQYQYTAPDGQVINLLYRADETGFHPSGDHLPTPPPIPPAIQRALDFLATKPPPIDGDY